jgi:hypothetical protein
MLRSRARRFTPISAGALALGLSGIVACSPAAKPRVIEMQPIGTVKQGNWTPEDDSEGDVTTPNAATPSPLKEAACSSTSFDDLQEALKGCEVPMPQNGDIPSGLARKLEVSVTPSTPTITAGGRVDLQVVFRNKSQDALPLFFTGDPEPRAEIEALTARGARADLPAGKQPAYPRGHSPPAREAKAYKVTLGGGGTARMKMVWDAVKTKWAPTLLESWEGRGYPRVPAGPLKKGKYTLRVVLPLLGVFEKGELEPPKVPITVGS